MPYAQKRICKECGKEFIAKSPRQFYCKDDHYRLCPVCGKPVLVKPGTWNDPPRTCSKECAQKLRENTNLKQYGCKDPGNRDEAKEKRKQTNLERYGVENTFQNEDLKRKSKETLKNKYGVEYISQLEENKEKIHQSWKNKSDKEKQYISDKRKHTCMKTYGVDNPRKSEETIEKIKATNLERYGTEWNINSDIVRKKSEETMINRYGTPNPMQNLQIREKMSQTCLKKYGVPHYSQSDEYKKKYKDTCMEKFGYLNAASSPEIIEKRKETNIEKYGVPAAFLTEENKLKARESILENTSSGRISKINRMYAELMNAAGLETEFEYILESYWYDIHIKNTNILIEIDPTYTHSTQSNCYGQGLDKNYHKNKMNTAKNHSFRCINVFDWDNPNKIVQLVCDTKTKYYARKLNIAYVENMDADKFYELYHIQGKVSKSTINIALYNDDNEIQSMMTFGSPRYSNKAEWELLRYASVPDVVVVGGASKIFHKFVNDYNPKSIISYCDNAKFTGELYDILGFKLDHISNPAKIWSKDTKKITDNLLRQRGYDQLFHTNYGKGSSNESLMLEHGWRTVYDCGQSVYIWAR